MSKKASVGIVIVLLAIGTFGTSLVQSKENNGVAHRVDALEVAVEALLAETESLRADVGALQTESATRQGVIDGLTTELAAAQGLIAELGAALAAETAERLAADEALEASIVANAVPQNLLDFASYLTVEPAGDVITLEAGHIGLLAPGGEVAIEAMNVGVDATANFEIKAMNIKNKAQMNIELESMNITTKAAMMNKIQGMMVNSQAGAINTVKGMLVKIN